MTELEYSEIFKTFNINDDNFMMKYSDSYYTIVRSNFSYEFANMIYNKYHNKKYGIRINGEGFDTPHKNQNIYTYHIDTKEGLAEAAKKGVFASPTVIFYNEAGIETARCHNVEELEAVFSKVAVSA